MPRSAARAQGWAARGRGRLTWPVAAFLGALLLAAAPAADGSNGKLAFLHPLPPVVVDGDLSEWPQDLPRYPVGWLGFGDRLGRNDLRASFRAGYRTEEQALYLAVEVDDESVVTGPEMQPGNPEGWSRHDGCEVYVDLGASTPGPLQFALYGNSLQVFGSGGIRQDDPWRAGAEVKVTRLGTLVTYEWRLDVRVLGRGEARVEPGVDAGLDVAVCDRDADGSFTWVAWGPGTAKVVTPGRLGTALLLAPGEDPDQAIQQFRERSLQGRTSEGDRRAEQVRASTSYQMFLTGALLAFTVVHLLLFAFYRQARSNLYYALFTGLMAAAIYAGFQIDLPSLISPFGPGTNAYAIALWLFLAVLLVVLAGLLFLYSLFYPRLPRRFWVFLVALGVPALFAVQALVSGGPRLPVEKLVAFTGFFILAAFVDMVRVVVSAVRRRLDGAWTVGLGFIAFGVAVLYLVVVNQQRSGVSLSAILGVFFPLASMSVYLARNFARVHRDLEAQLAQVQELSTRTQEQNRALERANQQIQEQNRQIQQANRLKSEFLARMSHDLRTPMNAIIGYTRILLRKTTGVLDGRQYRNLENIRISADQLLVLINDILDLSRIEAGHLEVRVEPVDVRQLASECAVAVAPLLQPGVELVQQLEPVPTLRTDPDRLRRILTNLLGNAAKFTHRGRVTLSLRPVAEGVELGVADTGIGIPEEELPHIYDEFRQVARKGSTAQEGTGLGLAIVKKYVDLLGGRIAVDTSVGEGTRFVLQLSDWKPGKETAP